MNDLKYAFRQLLKHPGFTIVAVVTLAVGIGANTAIFSVVNALLLRPLPYPDPDRLFWMEEVSKGNSQEPWGGHFLHWREHSQTLEGIAAYDYATWTLISGGEPERVQVGQISAEFLPLLGVQPISPGRNFRAAEDRPGGEHVAILSHHLWQRNYNAARDIVGRSIALNDTSYTVIGVLPPDFRFADRFDVWTPLALDAQEQLAGESRFYGPTIARLKPGISPEKAQIELDTLVRRYEMTRPEGRPRIDCRTRLVPLQTHLQGDTRRPMWVMLGAVAFVLLIACANVANLVLARSATRQKEFAIRVALGAGRWRLTWQMLAESLLLALGGGAAGMLLAEWVTGLIRSMNLTDALGGLSGVATIRTDASVLIFALLLSLVTGLLFGLLPALRLSNVTAGSSLKAGDRTSKSYGRGLRAALTVSEVAFALVLLTGAGLLLRSFAALLDVNPGYRTDNLLTARVQLPPHYRENSRRIQFYERVLQRAASLPGVVSVGATSHLPLTRYNMGGTLRVEGAVLERGEPEPSTPIASVNPDYFPTMGIRLRAGRLFRDGDAEGAPAVAVLSESLARQLFPDRDPVGRRLRIAVFGDEWTTIVGVVSDIRHQGLDQGIERAVYLSYRQMPRPGMAFVLRAAADPAGLAPALRNVLHEVDPSLPLYEVMTMDARVSSSVAARRFNLALLGVFAGIALLLAGVGVYGVIAYLATERTQEIGIRMALGATRREVIALVLRQGVLLAGVGIAIGVPAAFGLSRVLKNLLYGITPADPVTFVCVPFVLLFSALVASWLPAKRASRVDPMVALRSE